MPRTTGYRAALCTWCIVLLGAVFVELYPTRSFAQSYFQAQVPVTSQSTSVRKQAAEQALAEVLVRMSGSQQVVNDPAVQRILPQAINYVEEFQYATNDDQEQRFDGLTELLTLDFSPVSVERLLRQEMRLPFWPVNRPVTLVWLVEDSIDYGRQLVTSDVSPEIYQSLNRAALKRGLPLSYPLMDLQDQMALTADQVWGLDEVSIIDASIRYQADVILVGRYSATSAGRYLATWQFIHRGESRVYDSRAETVSELGSQALNPLADYLGARYAIDAHSGEGSSALVMQLQGVEDFSAYSGAIQYLENLALTTKVVLASVRNDTLLLYLSSDAGVDKFISTLALDSKLVPVTIANTDANVPVWMQVPQGSLQNPLTYRWQ